MPDIYKTEDGKIINIRIGCLWEPSIVQKIGTHLITPESVYRVLSISDNGDDREILLGPGDFVGDERGKVRFYLCDSENQNQPSSPKEELMEFLDSWGVDPYP